MPTFNYGAGFRSDPMDAFNQTSGMVKQSRLAKMLGGYYQNGQADLGQIAEIDPQAAQAIQAQQKQSGLAALLGQAYNAPEDQRQGILAKVMGLDPDMGLRAVKAFDPRFAAAGDGTPSDIRSLQMLQGNPELLKLDRERRQAAGMVPKLAQTADGYGWATPGGGIELAPVTGVAGQPQPSGGEVPFAIDPRLPPEVQAAIRANPQQWDAAQDGAQVSLPPARIAQPRDQVMTPYQQASLGLQQQKLQTAMQARDQATQAKQEAAAVKAQNAQRATSSRQAEASAAATQLVSAIDGLVKAPGFNDLGTTFGDVKLNTPLIRNDAKDADAQLKNVAGQVALTTMARLKALSTAGATGFGSLTAPELKLLENSIATLQSDRISNPQLKASLKTIRDSMEKVTKWQPQGQQAPSGSGGGGLSAQEQQELDALRARFGRK